MNRSGTRLLSIPILVLLAALALAACGGGDGTDGGTSGDAGTGGEVTIRHEYGVTKIPEPVERVVTVGYNDQDFALALGVKPIAVREWFGEKPFATWPWAKEALGDAEPEVLPSGELNFEQIAALHPDLILGVYSGMSAADYKKLSKIAPTVPQTAEFADFGVPWQEQLTLTGKALGLEAKAKQITDSLEAEFAQVRKENPDFAKATAVFAYLNSDGSFGAYSDEDPRGHFLESLGFESSPEINRLAGDEFFVEVSGERLRLLDQDVLAAIELPNVSTSQSKIESEVPLFGRLNVVRDGRVVYPDDEVGAALSFASPLSLPVAIEGLVPELEKAVAKLPADGGPAGQ